MEAQEEFVLQFHLNLVLERENGPFCLFDFFSFSSFQNSLLVHILINCKCNAYDANDMIKC